MTKASLPNSQNESGATPSHTKGAATANLPDPQSDGGVVPSANAQQAPCNSPKPQSDGGVVPVDAKGMSEAAAGCSNLPDPQNESGAVRVDAKTMAKANLPDPQSDGGAVPSANAQQAPCDSPKPQNDGGVVPVDAKGMSEAAAGCSNLPDPQNESGAVPLDAKTMAKANLPDPQNDGGLVPGADVSIEQVGVAGFRLPLRYPDCPAAGKLETMIEASVGLRAGVRGINMSRLLCIFYEFQEESVGPEMLEMVLRRYCRELRTDAARLKLSVHHPLRQVSLVSDLCGWQYYPVVFEASLTHGGAFRFDVHFTFTYSSACPCSSELAQHAVQHKGIYSIPHSQRSKARVSLQLAKGASIKIETIARLCAEALKTETQVLVKRVDEQAFAELNGQHVKFVEDAARILYQAFDKDERLESFRITCAHLESLHSYDAVASIAKGDGFKERVVDFPS